MTVVPVLIAATLFTINPPLSLVLHMNATRYRGYASNDGREGSVILDSAEIDRVHRVAPIVPSPELAISAFDSEAVAEFQKGWNSVKRGAASFESVILILRTPTGYQARRQSLTFEYKQCTFAWHPATIAVVHTHPNDSPPVPLSDDIRIADKYHVPMFTLSSRGMYVYDPITRKIAKVMDRLNWLDSAQWDAVRELKRQRN
jgi:hypothetical protein